MRQFAVSQIVSICLMVVAGETMSRDPARAIVSDPPLKSGAAHPEQARRRALAGIWQMV